MVWTGFNTMSFMVYNLYLVISDFDIDCLNFGMQNIDLYSKYFDF